jgi:hypothetical protein
MWRPPRAEPSIYIGKENTEGRECTFMPRASFELMSERSKTRTVIVVSCVL